MTAHRPERRGLAVPSRRLSRIARLGGVTAGVASSMAMGSISALSRGNRPVWRDLLMTPQNISRVADQLAKMRGAAMKVGQLVSMDTGEFLPPELAQIMARLRDEAHFMPPSQLKKVLAAQWPDGWLRQFKNFNVRPIAAASIGQVHSATLKDGRNLAIKVQYPGVANSIDSDIANVGALIRMSGLLPKGFELAPYLEEARKQLHEETDYSREAGFLQRFGTLLEGDDRFFVPKFVPEWSTKGILAMEFASGDAIDSFIDASQDVRNRLAHTLIDLALRELFAEKVMQTDPNFANYRYNVQDEQIVLLDFGATRDIPNEVSNQYRQLMQAGMSGDRQSLADMALCMGFYDHSTAENFRETIIDVMMQVFDVLLQPAPYDFGDRSLVRNLQQQGIALAEAGFIPPPLPVELLFIQRKLGGVFLLATHLRAQVDVQSLLARYL